MKTPAKQTAHRVAAVLAIATALATSGAWAWEKYYWTGAVSTDYHTAGNWNSNHVAVATDIPHWRWGIDQHYETADIVSYRIDIAQNAYGRGGWVVNAGTAAQPLEFYCATGSTIVSPDSSQYDYASALTVASTCDSWVWINGGQWDEFASYVTIGSSDYAGHLIIGNDRGVDTLFKTTGNFTFNQGSIAVSNATVNIGGQLVVGNIADKLTSFYSYNSTMVIDNYFTVNNSAIIDLCGGSVTNSAQHLTVDGSGEMTIRDSGRYACQEQLVVGNYSAGTLNIIDGGEAVSGTMLSLGYRSGSSAIVNIANGGILTVPYIYLRDANASATVSLDGGTIRAAKDNEQLIRSAGNLYLTVGANGGTIDAAGYNVTIEEDLDNASGETGAMTFKGGGTVTLSGAMNYTGGTTVEVGTTLIVESAIAKDKLAFTIPEGLANGVYELVRITGGAVFPEDVLDNVTQAPNAQFVLNNAKTGIYLHYGNVEGEGKVWVGVAGDGKMSSGENWLDNKAPEAGDMLNFSAATANLALSADLGDVTLSTMLFGTKVVTIADGSLYVSALTNANKLAIAQGASLTVTDDLVGYAATNDPKPLLYSNEGTVTVGGCVHFRSNGTSKGNSIVHQYAVANENSSPIIASGLAYNADSWSDYLVANLGSMNNGVGKWVIGANGLTIPYSRQIDKSGFRAFGTQTVKLYSSADWTLDESYRHQGNDLYIADSATVTVDTTDYTDNTVRRTVTFNGYINARGSAGAPLTVSGCGTLVLNSVAANNRTNVVAGAIAVTDSATLQINKDVVVGGSGTISLAEGTTLALESTGREFATPEIVPVALPAEGAATIRIDGTRLRTGEHILCTIASVPENLADHVAVTGEAIDGRKCMVKAVEVTVDEATVTKLVATIRSDGLMVIFR